MPQKAPRVSVDISSGRNVTVNGDIVGGAKITLNNSRVNVSNPSGGGKIRQKELITHLNMVLPEALEAEAAQQKLMICMDHWDEARKLVAPWVRNQLLHLLVDESDDYTNLWVMVAGREVPLAERAEELRHLLCLQEVGPLDEEFIRSYWLEKRHLDPRYLEDVIKGCRGNALAMVRKANAEEMKRNAGFVHA